MWFRCSGGNGTGDGATITVTYSEEFYGVTLTATNGVKTVTKVAPSTGSVDIDVPEGGSWVISATIGGETYSSEPVEVELEYATVIESVPNGSTVLPTDDIQTWLKCARIRDKAYTTLSEVLADTDTFETLCADSNACDYMVRSTTWASGVTADATAMMIVGLYDYCANTLLGDSTWYNAICNSQYFESVLNTSIPTMTSNSAPKGSCFSSSTYSGYYAWNAFDKKLTSYFVGASKGVGHYVGYIFTEPVIIKKFFVQGYYYGSSSATSTLTKYKIQTLDSTGTNWVDISPEYTYAGGSTGEYRNLDLNTPYTYYRIYVTAMPSGDQYTRIAEFNVYGRKSTSASQLATIHSAANDSIYYLDNGSPVTIATTDADGVGTVDLSSLSDTLTLYSTVAKNPTDLSADYSKAVRVNENVTEVYVMPIKYLYWWGNQSSNLEEMSTANGWSNASGYSYKTPTYNINSIAFVGASSKLSGVGMKSSVSIATLYSVTNGTAGSYIAYNATKTHASPTVTVTNSSGNIAKFSLSVNNTRYAWSGASDGGSSTMYALWYE